MSHWIQTRDGDPLAAAIYRRHYSCRQYRDGRRDNPTNRNRNLFVGPGEKLILVTPDYTALFAWRKFIDKSGQFGINCAVFRNESTILASELIKDACDWAWQRWPGQRLYTYVDASAVRSHNPGYCFLRAGWSKYGITKKRKLIILELNPEEVNLTTLTRRNPLATATDITLASETNNATTLHYDYALVPAEHRSAIMLSARRIKDKAERTKRDILDIGKELTDAKAKLEHGQFGDWLSVEFGMSDRSAQRFMSVYETYGAKSDTVSLLNDSALYLLSGPSVPEAARQEVEQQAQTTGKSPTKAQVQQVIARHKPPTGPVAEPVAKPVAELVEARFLNLDETEAVLWRTARHATNSTDRNTLATWLAQHWAVDDYKELLKPGVQIKATIFSQAFQRIRQSYQIKGANQSQETAHAEAQPPVPPVTPATAPNGEAIQTAPRTQRITHLIAHYQLLVDLLPDYGELTGDFTAPNQLRRALEPMIKKLKENLV